MSSIDERVVQMRFENSRFATGVKSTLSALASLKSSLRLDGASRGITDAARGVDQLQTSAGRVGASFTAMQAVVFGALASIGARAAQTGQSMASALTIQPVTTGLHEYETNLKSIQTILANTQASGATLDDVNSTLEELNTYSDQTIYNFAEMAKNIGTFTAAGVGLKPATASIKGIANLAALSGSSSEQAAGAMYQLSQAISAGRVSLMDWNSVVNAGMGGTVFQRALAQTAVAMGELDAGAVKLTGDMKNVKISGESFRDSISASGGEPSWLTSEVLTSTLAQFTGDMDAAALKTQGFTEAQIEGIMKQAETAKKAATEVKTLSGVFDVAKETAGSGWAKTWQLVFGDFEEAKGTFTAMSNGLNNIINGFSDARNGLLQSWKNMGGRKALLQALTSAFATLQKIMGAVGRAYRDIFPAKTGVDLIRLTVAFREFVNNLRPSPQIISQIRRIAAGLFAVIGIGVEIVKAVISGFRAFFGELSGGSGALLGMTAGLGDFLVAMLETIRESGFITSFFQGLGKVLAIPVKIIGSLIGLLGKLFSGFDVPSADAVSGAMDQVGETMDRAGAATSRVMGFFRKVGAVIGNLGAKIGDALSGIGDSIAKHLTAANFDRAIDVVQTGLLGALVLMIRKFFAQGINVDLTGGLFDTIKGTLGSVTEAMQTMQSNLKADTLLKIASALGIMAAAIFILSTIDPEKLALGLGGMAVGFLGLSVATIKVAGAVSYLGAAKLPFITAAMAGLAVALIALATALKIMSTISWMEIGQGLTAMAGSLLIIAGAMRLMPKGMALQAASLLVLSVALNALAVAMKIFATMDWMDIAQGLAALAGALTAIVVAMRLMPAGMLLQAAALVAIALAINAIAVALRIFGTIGWEEMGRGMAALAGSLAIIAAALHAMPKNILAQAAALAVVAVSLNLIALALKAFGGQSWEEIGRGLATLGGALLILAGGLYLMTGTLAGAAALAIASASLMLLIPTLISLGLLDWETIIKGLTALAGIFVVLGVAGLLLAPIVPVILGLGAAMVLIGASFLLAGAGALAFATAFGIVVATGAAGVAILADLLKQFIAGIAPMLEAFGEGVGRFAAKIGEKAGEFARAFTAILSAILQAILNNIPKIAAMFGRLLDTAIRVIGTYVPKIIQLGIHLIMSFLRAIEQNIGQMVTLAASIIVKFINGIANSLGKIIQAGVNLVLSFIEGVADAIRNNSERLGRAGVDMAIAIVEGMIGGLKGAAGRVWEEAKALGSSALDGIKSVLGIASPSKEFAKIGKWTVLGFLKGLKNATTRQQVQAEYDNMRKDLSAFLTDTRGKINDIVKRREELRKDKKTGSKEYKILGDQLAKLRREYGAVSTARTYLIKNLDDENAKLKDMASRYQRVTDKLEEASTKLEDAKRTRDDYMRSLKDSYSDFPEINERGNLVKYIYDFEKQIADTQQFATAIQELRRRGLNDTMYKELLAKGPSAMPFVQQILDQGKSGVGKLNELGAALDKEADKLAKDASSSLYQAGVNAAQGLVDGLKKEQKAIEAYMDKIADTMVASLKKKLAIKSPSRVMQALGVQTAEGLSVGLRNSASLIKQSSEALGDNAIDGMRKSIAGLGKAVSSEVDARPVISPVLDLNAVRKDASLLGSMLNVKPIDIRTQLSNAKEAAAGLRDNQLALDELVSAGAGDHISFTQNNYSPKALSSADIYRQTNNQLSRAKGALAT